MNPPIPDTPIVPITFGSTNFPHFAMVMPKNYLIYLAHLRLLNQKCTLLDLAGRRKRKKFWFKNLMGQFSIQPIIRLVFVGIVLLSERILSENAVVGSWAQLWLVRSEFPNQK